MADRIPAIEEEIKELTSWSDVWCWFRMAACCILVLASVLAFVRDGNQAAAIYFALLALVFK
jgi:hypothetical protein